MLYIRITLELPAYALSNSNNIEIYCARPLYNAPSLYKPTTFIIENNSLFYSYRSRIGINYKLG